MTNYVQSQDLDSVRITVLDDIRPTEDNRVNLGSSSNRWINGYFSGTLSNPSGALTLDEVTHITPRAGQPYACNSSHYGEIIFNTTAIGANGPPNSFYSCNGTNSWQPF
jgi:hypothetical protein